MAFLGRLLGQIAAAIIVPILNWVSEKIIGAVKEWLAKRAAKKRDEAKNQAVADQLAKAETPEERDEAADSARDNF